MESIIRNVNAIEDGERSALENVLGRKLQDNQQLLIHVVTLDIEPDSTDRDRAISRASAIARAGRNHAAAQGISPQEADDVIDAAIEDIRHERHM